MRSAGVLVAVVIGAGCAGGVGGAPAPLTEVRMVIDSDLDASNPVGAVVITPIGKFGLDTLQVSPRFPFVVAIKPDAAMHPFALTVDLGPPDLLSGLILVHRTVHDVAFVEGQQLMFVMPMLAKCVCQGTACPGPGDPDCDDLSAPALTPLDDRADRSPDVTIDLSRPPPIA